MVTRFNITKIYAFYLLSSILDEKTTTLPCKPIPLKHLDYIQVLLLIMTMLLGCLVLRYYTGERIS
jgi:hypothetical protein